MLFLDYYEVLDLPFGCENQQWIYSAYRRKLRELEPKPKKSSSFVAYSGGHAAKITLYYTAYFTLSDRSKKQFYDALLLFHRENGTVSSMKARQTPVDTSHESPAEQPQPDLKIRYFWVTIGLAAFFLALMIMQLYNS